MFEELKVFDLLYEKCKLKSSSWVKLSAGYIPNEKIPGYIYLLLKKKILLLCLEL